jgi:hypothetical protein
LERSTWPLAWDEEDAETVAQLAEKAIWGDHSILPPPSVILTWYDNIYNIS